MNEHEMNNTDIRSTTQDALTVEFAWNVGKAFADWLPTSGSVVIVSTSEHSELSSALIEGIRLQGRDVVDGGIGDRNTCMTYIKTAGLSGGAVISSDETEGRSIIELYQDQPVRIETETGLKEIQELIEAGNFVPAVTKGQLTAIA